MSLPEKGWTGYGRPGYRCAALRAADALQRQAYAADDAGHDMRELAFNNWLAGTVFGVAIERRLREIGESVR